MSATDIAWRTPRSVVLERWMYAAGAPVLAIAPNASPDGTVNGAILAAGAVATALVAKKLHDGAHGAGRTLIRLSPLVTALGSTSSRCRPPAGARMRCWPRAGPPSVCCSPAVADLPQGPPPRPDARRRPATDAGRGARARGRVGRR